MWVTWLANCLILIGMVLVGRKVRTCFLFSAAGELIWAVTSAMEGRYDLSSICFVFVCAALLNYRKWGRDKLEDSK